ncbi:MAG: CheR family methyltransferase [Pseudomonadota bacterium]|nr:CheR family methyltransferase [Pseudomonadota bacterium]
MVHTIKRTCGFLGLLWLELVTYRKHNLLDTTNSLGKFDLVLLHNVLIYFDQPGKIAVLDHIAKMRPAEGTSFLSGPEQVVGIREWFAPMEAQRSNYGPAT